MNIKLILSISLFLAVPLVSQNKSITEQTYDSLVQRIEILEGMKDNLEGSVANQKDHLKNIYDEFKNEVKNKNILVDCLLGFIALIGVASVITSFVTLRKYAEKKAKEGFEDAFKNHKNVIRKLIDSKNEELQLKKMKTILVLSAANSKISFLETFFNKMNFTSDNITFKNFVTDKKIDNNYDLIFLNDEDEKLIDSEIKQFQKDFNIVPGKTVCFYFGKKRVENDDRTTFANSRFQLYGNLMNALRYQDMNVESTN